MKANKRHKEKTMSETTTDELVQSIIDQNYTAATEIFNDMIGQKMQSALDQEKIAMADQIFNGAEPEEDDDLEFDEEDLELDDEEIDWSDDDELDEE